MITFTTTKGCGTACQNKETHSVQCCKSFSSNLWLQRKQHQFATFQGSELVSGVFYVCSVKRMNWSKVTNWSFVTFNKLPLELIRDLEEWTNGESLEGRSLQPRNYHKASQTCCCPILMGYLLGTSTVRKCKKNVFTRYIYFSSF